MTWGPQGNVLEGREQWSKGQQSGKGGNWIELKQAWADSCVLTQKNCSLVQSNQRKHIFAPWKVISVNECFYAKFPAPQRAKRLPYNRQKQTLLLTIAHTNKANRFKAGTPVVNYAIHISKMSKQSIFRLCTHICWQLDKMFKSLFHEKQHFIMSYCLNARKRIFFHFN